MCLFISSFIHSFNIQCSIKLALFSQPHQLFPFTFYSQIANDSSFFHTGISCFIPAYPAQTPPATSPPLGITIVLKSHGFWATGAGLEICILTCMAANSRHPYKPGMSPWHFLELNDMASYLSSLSPYRWKEEKTCLLSGCLETERWWLQPWPPSGLCSHVSFSGRPPGPPYWTPPQPPAGSILLPGFMLLLFLLRSPSNLCFAYLPLCLFWATRSPCLSIYPQKT